VLSTVLGFSPFGNGDDIEPFDRCFSSAKNIMEGIKGVDAVVLWGGADIPASFYGKKPHWSSQARHGPSKRDEIEWKAIQYCKMKGIPIIGICRGAQMLCAANGGTLIQDVSNHTSHHEIVTKDGEILMTNSLHHQMMNPANTEHELIAWSKKNISARYEGETPNDKIKMEKEPEIVYFPNLRGLAIQGHPEFFGAPKPFVEYCVDLVTKYLFAR
jgi:anthranilate/para-aminobenzoate synthase component II